MKLELCLQGCVSMLSHKSQFAKYNLALLSVGNVFGLNKYEFLNIYLKLQFKVYATVQRCCVGL